MENLQGMVLWDFNHKIKNWLNPNKAGLFDSHFLWKGMAGGGGGNVSCGNIKSKKNRASSSLIHILIKPWGS